LKEVDSTDTLNYWLGNSKTGDMCIYYEGFLMYDKEIYKRENPGARYFSGAIEATVTALEASSRGLVALLQKKIGEGRYDYYAVRL
jgi:hypothetical protein